MTALIIIDLQNDFLPGGSLAVPEGDKIIEGVNTLLDLPFDTIVATKDWHPSDHGSFADNHQDKKPGDFIKLDGIDQILWPAHCVQESRGAEFPPKWHSERIHKVIHKGTERNIDSYSCFFDNGHKRSTGLEDYLKKQNAHSLYIAGLATDYCVKYSVLDALELGFDVTVITDACRGIDLEPGDVEKALQEMQNAGAHLKSVNELCHLFNE